VFDENRKTAPQIARPNVGSGKGDSKPIPANAAADTAHIAFSAVHAMDFLLTWNCKHINNPHLVRRIERACAEHWLNCPVICTPEELLPL